MLEIFNYTPAARIKDYYLTTLSHLTPKKLLNMLHAEWEYTLRREKCSSFPYIMLLDPTNVCQLRCALCATGQQQYARPKGIMAFQTFKKIIDEIGDYLFLINISGWGEPFLNPQLLDFVNYASQKNVNTLVSTNFSHKFGQQKMEEIIKSGLGILVVSLDGITPKVYNQYRIGGNFQQVIKNIKLLAKTKMELRAKRPLIQWQFLVNKYNEHQIPSLKSFAKDLGVDSLVLEQTLIVFGQNKHNHLKLSDWLPKDKKYQPNDFSMATNRSKNTPGKCWWLWHDFGLSHDGGLYACCFNNMPEHDFGNILKCSFKEIWNNQHYISARSLFKSKKGLVKTVCHSCPIVLGKT